SNNPQVIAAYLGGR
ncbi:MAG: hypothetical protein J7M34_06365, partial [Anaerolineae bacterium]|nr:hypothetical protein [Anaerolineae bacterium]